MKAALKFLGVVVVAVMAAAGSANAGTIPGPESCKCQVYSPDGWKTQAVQKGHEAVLISVDPTHVAGLFYAVVEAKNLDAASKGIDAILAMAVKDVKASKPGALKVNGMDAIAFTGTGTGTDDGKPVSLAAVILMPAPNRVLVAVGMVQTDKAGAFKGEFDKALAGIQKLK